MNALAKVPAPAAVVEPSTAEVLIHVRFLPSAEIFSIDGRPEHLPPRVWLDRLLEAASMHYQALAGGRGFFRIPRATFDAISTAA
jgi:hypothetical protein